MRDPGQLVTSIVLGLTVLGASASDSALAQQTQPAEASPASRLPRSAMGVELDALPFALGGYYGSLWAGRGTWRARGVVSRSTLPAFVVPDGFRDHDLTAYAVLIDRFFRSDFRGFWLGGGAEYWQNDVTRSVNGQSAGWSSTVATVGGGYVWKFYRNVYLNPWVAAHVVVSGDRRISVGGADYAPKHLLGEASLKLGWHR